MTQISNKAIPVYSDAYFSRYDHNHFEIFFLLNTYENNIIFSKKQDKARYLARTNSWGIEDEVKMSLAKVTHQDILNVIMKNREVDRKRAKLIAINIF